MKYLPIILLLFAGCGEQTVTGPDECEVITEDSERVVVCEGHNQAEHAGRK